MRRRLFFALIAQLSVRFLWKYIEILGREQKESLREVLLGLAKVLEFAKVAPIEFVGAKRQDLLALPSQAQVRGNNRKDAFLGNLRQQARRNDVDARKSQLLKAWRSSHQFRFLIAANSPAAQFPLLVKKQITRTFPLLDSKSCQSVIFKMNFHNALKINCADDVHVVQDERLVQSVGILEKEPARFLQAAAGVEQQFFAGDFHLQAEIIFCFQVLNYQVGKMVHVDDDFPHA